MQINEIQLFLELVEITRYFL